MQYQMGCYLCTFLNTNTQSRDRCPIQFTGPSNATPVYNLNETDSITVEVMFENNTAGQLSKKCNQFMLMCFMFVIGTLTQ